MQAATAEWVVVGANTAVIASGAGRFWFLDLEPYGNSLPFSAPMTGAGSPESTRALLDGAVSLGLGMPVELAKGEAGSLAQYVLDLVGSYHNSRRTVPNYLRAASRLRALGRPEIAAYLERHAREENGHERLALRDLNALNLPGERIVANLIPDGVAALCELFDSLSSATCPVGCIGYSYFFESTAARRGQSELDALQALCPEGVDATRFMRAHSGLSSEADHVTDMIGFIATLPASDRTEIARAAHATAVTARSNCAGHAQKRDSEVWAEIWRAAGEQAPLPA